MLEAAALLGVIALQWLWRPRGAISLDLATLQHDDQPEVTDATDGPTCDRGVT